MTCRCNEPAETTVNRRVGEVLVFTPPSEPIIGTVVQDDQGVLWQRRGALLAPSYWVPLQDSPAMPLPAHNWPRLMARGPVTIVAVPKVVSPEGHQERMAEAFLRARALAAQVPVWARPVVTRPLPATEFSNLRVRRAYEDHSGDVAA